MRVLVTIIDKSGEKPNVGRKLEKEFKKDAEKEKNKRSKEIGFFRNIWKVIKDTCYSTR